MTPFIENGLNQFVNMPIIYYFMNYKLFIYGK